MDTTTSGEVSTPTGADNSLNMSVNSAGNELSTATGANNSMNSAGNEMSTATGADNSLVSNSPASNSLANNSPLNNSLASNSPSNSPADNSLSQNQPIVPNILENEDASPTPSKKRVTRSNKQAAADAGQAEQLQILRDMYASEFSNIPEKFRPKPKAYVARAAYYKAEGSERNSYIRDWLEKDREAAEVRMGRKVPSSKSATAKSNSTKKSPSLLSIASTRKVKFNASANPLRAQAAKAEEKIRNIANKMEASLMAKAVNKETRTAAHKLAMETKKVAHHLVKEIRIQAEHLERAAVKRFHTESKAAFSKMENRARENLTAVMSGRVPSKRNTRRLAKMRNSGRTLGAENFLREQRFNKTRHMDKNVTPIKVTPEIEEAPNSVEPVPVNDYEYR